MTKKILTEHMDKILEATINAPTVENMVMALIQFYKNYLKLRRIRESLWIEKREND